MIGVGGGVGTTTVSVLLAAALASRSATLVVDLDQRHGALAGTLRATPRATVRRPSSAHQEILKYPITPSQWIP